MPTELRVFAPMIVALALFGCRRDRADGPSPSPTAAFVDAASSREDASLAPSAVMDPSFDGDAHCASLRTIAGYMKIVPAWASDAGYLRNIAHHASSTDLFAYGDDVVAARADDDAGRSGRARGKEIPSGFVACEHSSTTVTTRRNGASYECTSRPIPNDDERGSRFAELARVWRRCLTASGLKEVRMSASAAGVRALTFTRPGPASDFRSCSLDARDPVLRIACARFEGED
jgi:hypothetical protein